MTGGNGGIFCLRYYSWHDSFIILLLTWQFYYITADMAVLLYYCWHDSLLYYSWPDSFIILLLTCQFYFITADMTGSFIILQLTWQCNYFTADVTGTVLLHYSWHDVASFITLQLRWRGQFYYITADLTRPALYLCFNSDKKILITALSMPSRENIL